MVYDNADKRPLCVTLEKPVTIPGPNHFPPQLTVFRAAERSVGDEFTLFLDLNVGPEYTTVEVRNENIRSVCRLGQE